jgi:predicted hydrocarbon binding protein
MRSHEFLTERTIGTLTIDGIRIEVDDHAIERAEQRKVKPANVDRILRKIGRAKNQIKKLDDNQEFWLWWNDLEVSLGMVKKSSDPLRLKFNTVINNRPHQQGINPVIEIH